MTKVLARASRGLTLIAIAGAVAVLAACGGGDREICSGPPLTGPFLVYPTNGTTGVPDGNFSLVLSTGFLADEPGAFLSNATLYSLNGNVNLPLGNAPSAIPTPYMSPAPPASTLLGANVPALAAHTTYNFQVTTNVPGNCGGVSTGTIGTFTTI